MSNYDMLPRGSQIKLWECNYKTYRAGDEVSGPYPQYIVLLAEGGYIRVKDGVITKIVENLGRKFYYPEDFKLPCLDKWGGVARSRADLEHINIMGGRYYWQEEEKDEN